MLRSWAPNSDATSSPTQMSSRSPSGQPLTAPCLHSRQALIDQPTLDLGIHRLSSVPNMLVLFVLGSTMPLQQAELAAGCSSCAQGIPEPSCHNPGRELVSARKLFEQAPGTDRCVAGRHSSGEWLSCCCMADLQIFHGPLKLLRSEQRSNSSRLCVV